MRNMFFTQAIDDALAQAMAGDPNIILFGEDIALLRRNLLVRFGPRRVRGTPISESAFLGAGVAAAMAGLRPVVEIYMVDFLGVCLGPVERNARDCRSAHPLVPAAWRGSPARACGRSERYTCGCALNVARSAPGCGQ